MHPRIIPPPATLDKWDIAFIRHFKSGDTSINTLMTIWAERVGMEINPISFPGHIAEYLANLIDRLNLTPDLFRFIMDMAPHRGWQFCLDEKTDYTERAIHVMGSWLRLTEVKYLPGYSEAVKFPYPLPLDGATAHELDADSERDGSHDYGAGFSRV